MLFQSKFFNPKKEITNIELNLTKRHLEYCFDSVLNSLKNKTKNPLPFLQDLRDIKIPLFITWRTINTNEIKGCIGKEMQFVNNQRHI